MRAQRNRLPLLLLLPPLTLAGCSDRPEPTAPAPARPAFDHATGDTCVVTSAADGGAGTLRDAIDNHACGTITFDITGTIELTTGQLTIDRDVTITGPGPDQLTVRRSATVDPFRIFAIVFTILDPTHAFIPTVEISGLTISGGACGGQLFCRGGGIHNGARLTVTRSTISGNAAQEFGVGGGIYNLGELTVTHSTISGNTAFWGGGIYIEFRSITLVVHSTISGNTAVTLGGGILAESDVRLSVSHSTISDNSASDVGGIVGRRGSLFPITFRNTILARNGENCFDGEWADAGYNLEDGGSSGFSASTSHSSTDPLIGPLADNGGPTETHAFLADSPAIDAGTCEDHLGSTVTDDQRGVERPQGLECDIGAFELEVSVEDLLTALIALSEETPGVSGGTVNKLRVAL